MSNLELTDEELEFALVFEMVARALAERQRDADWKRIEPLIESASQALAYFDSHVTPRHPIAEYLRHALAQLEGKP